jgi:hypothetical protein
VDAGVVDSWEGRTQGRGAGCEEELVVFEPVFVGAIGGFDADAFVGAIDFDGFGVVADVELEKFFERLRSLHGEGIAFFDFAADVVWQAAIGEGDVGSSFEHDNLGGLAEAAGAGCGGGASGDATDDEEARGTPVFSRGGRCGHKAGADKALLHNYQVIFMERI